MAKVWQVKQQSNTKTPPQLPLLPPLLPPPDSCCLFRCHNNKQQTLKPDTSNHHWHIGSSPTATVNPAPEPVDLFFTLLLPPPPLVQCNQDYSCCYSKRLYGCKAGWKGSHTMATNALAVPNLSSLIEPTKSQNTEHRPSICHIPNDTALPTKSIKMK
jgi:hypothetical protein